MHHAGFQGLEAFDGIAAELGAGIDVDLQFAAGTVFHILLQEQGGGMLGGSFIGKEVEVQHGLGFGGAGQAKYEGQGDDGLHKAFHRDILSLKVYVPWTAALSGRILRGFGADPALRGRISELT